ncbi:MAG: hypothetical protein IJ389_00235 [Clostridia bacterium]|nr:hypothetical protein [Clostridia bacterium]
MKNKKINMGLPLVALGMFFLVNPVITIIDVIPDFIGYILMVYGLDKLADMEDRFTRAKRSFSLLAIISAVKTAVCLLLPVLDGTFVILFSFVFAVGEAVCFIPGMISLFGGFHYYGMRHESNACYGVYKKRTVSYVKAYSSDSVLVFSIIAFAVRSLACFLPQLPIILQARSTITIYTGARVDWTYFVPHFYFFASIIALAVGIPWAFRMRKYILGIASDEKLMTTLNSLYDENIAGDESHFAEKKTAAVKILTILGAVFCFSIYIDYVNWLPGGVAGAFFASAAIMMRKHSKAALPTAITGFLTVIPSCAELLNQYLYTQLRYTPESFANGIGQSEKMYIPIIISEILTAVFLIITIWLFAKCLSDMIRSHCAIYEKVLPETRSGKGEGLCKSITGAYTVAFALMTAMCVASAAHGILAVYYPESWLINAFIGVAMLIFLIRAINIADDDLYDRLKNRM